MGGNSRIEHQSVQPAESVLDVLVECHPVSLLADVTSMSHGLMSLLFDALNGLVNMTLLSR